MEVPLNYTRPVTVIVLADVQHLTAKCKDHEFPTSRSSFLQSKFLAAMVGERCFNNHCPIFIWIISNSEKESWFFVLEEYFEMLMDDGELLMSSADIIEDGKLSSGVWILADFEYPASSAWLNTEIFVIMIVHHIFQT